MTPEQLSENLRKTLNTFLNPFALPEDVYQVTGGRRPLVDILGHAGGLALGYGAMGALLMALLKKRYPEGLPPGSVKSLTNVEYSPVSLDTDLEDTDQEKKEREMGLARAQEKSAAGMDLREREGKTPYYHLALALAGTVGGGVLGARSMAQWIDKRREKEMAEDIAKKRNLLDKILYEEYLRTHEKTGQEKEAGWEESWEKFQKVKDEWFNKLSPVMQEILAPILKPFKTFHAASSLWAIYAVATLAAGYSVAKSASKRYDPARERAKKIEAFGKRRALSNAPPQLLSATEFSIAKEKAAKPPKVMSSVPVM